MAACLMKGMEPVKLDWQSVATEDFKNKKIDHEKYSVLNKALKAGYPEAWFYWLNTVEVLANEKKVKKTEVTKETAVGRVGEVKEEAPKKNNEVKRSRIQLVFIVNGKETLADGLNANQPLAGAVEKALAQTGNSGRPIEEWLEKWNNHDLDIKGHIPECDGIWMGFTIWEFIAKTGKSLKELIQEVYDITGTFWIERNDLYIDEAIKNKVLQHCKNNDYKQFGKYKVQCTDNLEGYKFFFDENTWLMIRASVTEHVLRAYV